MSIAAKYKTTVATQITLGLSAMWDLSTSALMFYNPASWSDLLFESLHKVVPVTHTLTRYAMLQKSQSGFLAALLLYRNWSGITSRSVTINALEPFLYAFLSAVCRGRAQSVSCDFGSVFSLSSPLCRSNLHELSTSDGYLDTWS